MTLLEGDLRFAEINKFLPTPATLNSLGTSSDFKSDLAKCFKTRQMSKPKPISQDEALIQSFAPPDQSLNLVPIAPKRKRMIYKRSEKRFVRSLSIVTGDGKIFKVPISQESAKAEQQLLAAKLMKAYSANVEFILDSNMVMEPKALADFMKAGQTISAMVEAAHKGTPIDNVQGGTSAIGIIAGQMMKGAMEGAVGSAMSLEDRMRRISELGKKAQTKVVESNDRARAQAAKPEIVIEVPATQPTESPPTTNSTPQTHLNHDP